MPSQQNPLDRTSRLGGMLQLLPLYTPWVLLPLALVIGMLTRHLPQQNAAAPGNTIDSQHKAVRSAIRAISFSADEQSLDFLQSDMTWRRHDAKTGQELWRRSKSSTPLAKTAIHSAELLIAGRAPENRLAILRDDSTVFQGILPGQVPGEELQSIAWSPSGKFAAVVSDRGSLWILNTADFSAKTIERFSFDQSLDSAAWSSDGHQIAIVTADGKVLVWDVLNAQLIGELDTGDVTCHFATWSQNNRQLIACCFTNSVSVWNAETMTLIKRLPSTSQAVMAAALSPDGRFAAVGETDQIAIWDLEAKSEASYLVGHDAPVCKLQFNSTGTTLYSLDYENQAICWSLTDGRMVWSFPDQVELEASARSRNR